MQSQTPEATVLALFETLKQKLAAPEQEFNDAAHALADTLLSPRTKANFYGKPFIEQFMRKTLGPFAVTAQKTQRDLQSHVTRINKDYDIKA